MLTGGPTAASAAHSGPPSPADAYCSRSSGSVEILSLSVVGMQLAAAVGSIAV